MGRFQLVLEIGAGRFQNGLLIFLTGVRLGEGHDAEDISAGIEGPVQVTAVVQGLHIDGALFGGHQEFAVGVDAAADIAAQPLLKGVAVEALEHQLAQFQQDQFVHSVSSFIRNGSITAGSAGKK